MKQDDYDKIASVIPMSDIIDSLVSRLKNAVDDAANQSENGSQLGMAVAVGRISTITDDLMNAWLSVKK